MGNEHGLLEFDGSNWTRIAVPGQRVVAIDTDSAGTVFVGSETNIGYLRTDRRGQRSYVSLTDPMTAPKPARLSVVNVICTPRGVFGCTDEHVYRFRQGQKPMAWTIPGGLRQVSQVGAFLYIQSKDGPLYSLPLTGFSAKCLVPLRGLSRLADEAVMAILPSPTPGEVVVVTQTAGLFRYRLKRAALTPLPTPVDGWMRQNRVRRVIYVQNMKMGTHSYIVGTERGGVRLLDETGRVRQAIDETNGLRRNTVLSVFQDREQSLWISTGSGLDRVETNLPVSRFESSLNIHSTVRAIGRHGGTLYVGTDLGLMRWNDSTARFESVPGTRWGGPV